MEPGGPHGAGEDRRRDGGGIQSTRFNPTNRFYQGWFSACPNALLAAAITPGSTPREDVVKRGYLGELDRSRRRYFVLREGSHTGPSRLEWYGSAEKFRSRAGSAGGTSKPRVIYLRCCLGMSKTTSSKRGHTVALYAKDQTLVLVAQDRAEQEDWYWATKSLMEERGQGFDDEDDGYCTLAPADVFQEVWPVTVKPRGLGRTKSLAGEARLCLAAASLLLMKVGAREQSPPVKLPLLSVRRFGHSDGLFFVELGRSVPHGPGELWMEAGDQGDSALAQEIHEVVRDAMRSLRALPDFSQSPSLAQDRHQNHTQQVRTWSRPKPREKGSPARPAAFPLPPQPTPVDLSEPPAGGTHRSLGALRAATFTLSDRGGAGSPTSSSSNPSLSTSGRSFRPEPSSYMEMTTDRRPPAAVDAVPMTTEGSADGRTEGPESDEEEGVVYVMMSPQSCRTAPRDDYVAMASPITHPATSAPRLFNSSGDDPASRRSVDPPVGANPLDWPLQVVRRAEPESSRRETDVLSGAASQRPLQAPPSWSGRPASGRSWLASFLPSCLKAEEKR